MEKAEDFFEDDEQYQRLVSDLDEWLEASEEILREEMLILQGTIPQLEVIISHCNMVRQKVIDIKYLLYVMEYFQMVLLPNYDENSISIDWLITDISELKPVY